MVLLVKKVKKKLVLRGNPQFGQRIEKAKKGKGSYTRNNKHKKLSYKIVLRVIL